MVIYVFIQGLIQCLLLLTLQTLKIFQNSQGNQLNLTNSEKIKNFYIYRNISAFELRIATSVLNDQNHGKIFGSLQKVTVIFFGKINLESPFQHQHGIKKENKRKWISQEAIVTKGGSGLVSQTKTTYSDFLKTPKYLQVLRLKQYI